MGLPQVSEYLAVLSCDNHNTNKTFPSHLPKFFKMCLEIHEMRLSSHLSHSEIKATHTYTGPIQQNKRKAIQRLIKEGIDELALFW